MSLPQHPQPQRNVTLPTRDASLAPVRSTSYESSKNLAVRSNGFDSLAPSPPPPLQQRERSNSNPIDDAVQTALPDPKYVARELASEDTQTNRPRSTKTALNQWLRGPRSTTSLQRKGGRLKVVSEEMDDES